MNTQLEGMTYVKCLEKLLRKTSWHSRIKLFFKENASAASDMLSNHGLARHKRSYSITSDVALFSESFIFSTFIKMQYLHIYFEYF